MAKTKRTCPACGSENVSLAFIRGGVHYYRCADCGTIFSKPLNQADMVGGGAERERRMQNAERIARFINLKGKRFIALDYGCGNGYLVHAMADAGIAARGYDPFNKVYKTLPDMTADLVCMIEVIEHMSRKDFDNAMQTIDGVTVPGSILYIETCFCEVCGPDSPYIEPKVGHSTIWSYAGMDAAMQRHGWTLHTAINSTVRTYIKE